ncbi:DUF4625 domain-containing protein [Chitinophaga japonensis]|uniref:Uncharacterized protein DUF4625 n=1 Tax=Chitinophaga japonensis TaxID=104662 RepID=A0A562SUV3_CHIJA|nr:DUF4625 domain-containing protein [Chitinophaga japonensis]TWI84420.1 uncharacterized protein DUF4625 [Chitinophaga japonensis]
MRTNFRTLFMVLSISALFAACSDDDDVRPAAPSITEVEIGADNSKIGYAGSDFHIDAAITAAGSIANVQLEIHPESGAGWEYDSVYTEGFAGLKNAQFHEHIDIPADAAVGHYHLHLTVTDENGVKAEIEEEIEIRQDATLPSISGLGIELENNGNELHLETTITAPNKIAEVSVEIHGAWEEEYTYTDAEMVGQTTYDFHKHIDISAAPAGHYHVHIKVVDQAGKEREFEDHFDKP